MPTLQHFKPADIVSALDSHIVGQKKAKRSVAIALCNRQRRMLVSEKIRPEITPKNILMIGPTGVGKTEIARRLAKLANAPFVKIEATKFTEVGYVGRDVDSTIRDLMEAAYKMVRDEAIKKVNDEAFQAAEERILDALLPVQPLSGYGHEPAPEDNSITREKFRERLKNGELDLKEVEVDVQVNTFGVEIMAPPGMEEMTNQLQGMFQNLSNDRSKKRKMKVKDALKALKEDEASKLINEDDLKAEAVTRVEQTGIVFIDEIDKVTQRSDNSRSGGDVSREGVQRDLLPLIEGSTVNTKYGPVKTDHILFIASGAFHLSKPSDLIPELQGRLPVRVELDALTTSDFVRILTEPNASLTEQYKELLRTEKVELNFTNEGIEKLAELAWEINERTENIGARRLHTVMERLLEDISFEAPNRAGDTVAIDADYVIQQLGTLVQDQDLSRFIL